MLKYLKGYIFNGHTFVVNKEDIHNASDNLFVEATALLPMPDVITNGDRIRSMSDEDLADFFAMTFQHGVGRNLVFQWLRQLAEETA